MVKRKRDYKAEYLRRQTLGKASGLSKAQARGHRRAAEPPASSRGAARQLEDHKLQIGLRFLRKTKNFMKAAHEAHISPERLRSYAVEKNIIEKRGRRWVIKNDLPRRVLIYSAGREHIITVGDFKAASLVGKHMSAVGWFSRTNDISYIKPFIGKSVTDIDGKSYPLETRPNVLFRLLHAGGSSFEQIYRIVV